MSSMKSAKVFIDFSSDEGTGWTPVVSRRQKRRPVPGYVRRRFPPGHPTHCSNS